MHLEKRKQLQLVIPAAEHATIRDATTGDLIAVVVRDFCKDEDVIAGVNSTVEIDCSIKRSIRVWNYFSLVLPKLIAGYRRRILAN